MTINYDRDKFIKLCQKYGFSLVILHGSYAQGKSRAESDIDIGLLGSPQIIRKRYFDIIRDFTEIFGDKFDPVFLNGAEAMITQRVAVQGIALYEKERGSFSSFKLGAIARYMDTKKFRLLEKQYIKSVIENIAV